MARAEVTQASCIQCGAPLPFSTVPTGACRYCGREYRLSSPARSRTPAPRGSQLTGGLALLIGIALVTAIALGATALRLFAGGSSSTSPGQRPPRAAAANAPVHADAPAWWMGRSPMLLKSTHGDVPNVVAVATWPDGAHKLTALEGRSGKVLWHVPAANGVDVYTDEAELLLLFDPVKKLTRYAAQNGSELWTIGLADNVYDVEFGRGCANLLLPGPRKLGIETEMGQPAPCARLRASTRRDEPRDVQLRRGDTTFLASIKLDEKPVNPEPPRFAVRASRGGRELWQAVPASLEPIWTSSGFRRSVALTPSGLFVFGRTSADHHARWLLLDFATGRTLYEQRSTTKVDSEVHLAPAGPLVFVVHDRRLEAFRAATGERVWSIGPD